MKTTWRRLLSLALLLPLFPGGPRRAPALAQPTIPPTWSIIAEPFESGSLATWDQVWAPGLSLVPGGGNHSSTGLGVDLGPGESYIYRSQVAHATEGYLTFWLNPNGASIPNPESITWVPGKSVCLASVRHGDDWWPPLVAIYLRRPAGGPYQAYLAWPIDEQDSRFYDYAQGSFDLVEGWQEITIGYRVGEWVAAWHNGRLMRYATDVVHTDPYGDIVMVGKTETTKNSPSGTLRFDDLAFRMPRIDDLWVDAVGGQDDRDGLSPAAALRTIQAAADRAGPGTTVHILPGVYRETVWPVMDGSRAEPAVYRAENGPGTAIIRGSEPASALAWTQLTGNSIGLPAGVDPAQVWYADLSAWELAGPPRFVVELDGSGDVAARLPLAREPDWQVTTPWQHHQFWWAADGGSTAAGCDPTTDPDPNCDYESRSMTQLTDRSHDSEPPGIEPGNLATLGSLAGATLRAIDTRQGHYVYRRTIVEHDLETGRITVDRVCEHDSGSGEPGLGWGSKYYVENLPSLLDSPGEWWYDASTGRLYLWPRFAASPAGQNIEIARRDHGFNLSRRSYLAIDGLVLEFLNGSAIYQSNWHETRSYDNTVRNVTARYANVGVWIEQSVRADAPPDNVSRGFVLEGSDIGSMDSLALRLTDWWENSAAADAFTRSGVTNTIIRNNELHHLGFRSDGDNAVGASLQFANRLRFEGNHVHDVAHNGVQFSRSVIQSARTFGFEPAEIRTGDILIKDNLFERACQLTTDCGALKIWGSPPDGHVFRGLLITGNVFRDTFGWTYVSEKRRNWSGGSGSQVRGLGGFGLYVDMASGVHAYRNVAYNNAFSAYMMSGVWRDGPIVYVNNIAANSLYGFCLGSPELDAHPGSVDTQLLDNIILNNEGYGLLHSENDAVFGSLAIDHNLYHGNGWRAWEAGGLWKAGAMALYQEGAANGYYPTVTDIQAGTGWEDHGLAGDPRLWAYDVGDHELHDSSSPDWHPTAASDTVVDRGTAQLPASLLALLDRFDVPDPWWGAALDVGRYEAGFALRAEPPNQGTKPGGTARYSLSLFPADLPYAVDLAAASPSPSLTLTLEPATIAGPGRAVLTVADSHPGPTLLPGTWHTLSLTGVGSGFEASTQVRLLVGGVQLYLPLVRRP